VTIICFHAMLFNLHAFIGSGEVINLLNETRLTIGEVGQRVGFTEPAAFSRAFRQWTGISPHGYRQGLSGRANIPLPPEIGIRP
jgi:methylphosphotriester-DNA--protein-cysteine methyltransferase